MSPFPIIIDCQFYNGLISKREASDRLSIIIDNRPNTTDFSNWATSFWAINAALLSTLPTTYRLRYLSVCEFFDKFLVYFRNRGSSTDAVIPSILRYPAFRKRQDRREGKKWRRVLHSRKYGSQTEIVVWILGTLDSILEIMKYFAKYLKESCW